MYVYYIVVAGSCQRLRNHCSVTSRECIDVPGSVFCQCYEGYAGTDCRQSLRYWYFTRIFALSRLHFLRLSQGRILWLIDLSWAVMKLTASVSKLGSFRCKSSYVCTHKRTTIYCCYLLYPCQLQSVLSRVPPVSEKNGVEFWSQLRQTLTDFQNSLTIGKINSKRTRNSKNIL